MSDRELLQQLRDALYAMQQSALEQKCGLKICDDAIARAEARLAAPEIPQKPTAYVLHKARFDGSPYFTTALVEEAYYLLKDGYDIHQYLYVGAEPTPTPPSDV